MTNTENPAAALPNDESAKIVERIERLEHLKIELKLSIVEDMDTLNAFIKQVYNDAKQAGHNTTAIRAAVAYRKARQRAQKCDRQAKSVRQRPHGHDLLRAR